MLYDINYKTLVRLLLPTFLRKQLMFTFLKCMVSPVSMLHDLFMKSRANDLFRESIDCTIPRLEYLLNRTFYPEGLEAAYNYRIVVGTTKKTNALRIRLGNIMQTEDEGKPQFLIKNGELQIDNSIAQPKYLYTAGETGEINFDFLVKVPSSVEFDELRMRVTLQQYALPGKNFYIVKY